MNRAQIEKEVWGMLNETYASDARATLLLTLAVLEVEARLAEIGGVMEKKNA